MIEEQIQKLINYTKSEKMHLILDANLKKHKLRGCISWTHKTIWIDEDETEFDLLYTLAHEIGHYIAYERYIKMYGKYPFMHVWHLSEMDAYRYGWYIMKKLGIIRELGILKETWRSDHTKEISTYIKYEGNKPIVAKNKWYRPPKTWKDRAQELFLLVVGCFYTWVIVQVIIDMN